MLGVYDFIIYELMRIYVIIFPYIQYYIYFLQVAVLYHIYLMK